MMKYYSGMIDEGSWKTAAGDIAVFNTKYRRNLKSLVVQLEPIQAGSGNPSPDNVRPITGRTSATVTRTGKNLWPFNSNYTPSNYAILINNAPCFIPAGTYTFSAVSDIESDSIVLFGNHADGSRTEIARLLASSDRKSATKQVSKDIVSLYFASNSGGNISEIQLEPGTTMTSYEPYTGTTIPISWETEAGTVYNGEIDVVSGVLTVDRAAYVFTGAEEWTGYVTYGKQTFNIVQFSNNINTDGIGLMSRYKFYKAPYISIQPDKSFCFFATPQLSVCDNDYADAATFATSMAGSTLVYPLANPQTYQLTPQQIQTLIGENVIWSDAGAVSVEYWS